MAIDRHVSSVLVLHAGALGDCVLTFHIIGAMKRAWGDPAVTLAARSPVAPWAQKRGLVSEACSLERFITHRLYDPGVELPGETVRFLQHFDRIVSFLGGPTEPISARLSAIPGTRVLAVDPRPSGATLRGGPHITRQWADQLADYGFPVDLDHNGDRAGASLPNRDRKGAASLYRDREEAALPPVRIDLTTSERLACSERLAARLGVKAGRIALCHPGSGGLDKCCPLEALERLVGALVSRGCGVVWMVGPDEMERFGTAYLQHLRISAPVVYEESLEAAAELVCGAQVYIGNDAGMTHVATLAGVRTLALFGPTAPRVWRPLGDSCQIVGFPPGDCSLEAWVDDLVARIDSGWRTRTKKRTPFRGVRSLPSLPASVHFPRSKERS